MSWTQEQLLKHKKAASLLKADTPPPAQKDVTLTVTENPAAPGKINFWVIGDPMGKPRMTQRDVWKQRPVVLRYRDYCDRIVEAAPATVLNSDAYAISIVAYIAMPKSWSKKKQVQHWGTIHRTKPDWDNIGKAVCDALFKDDSILGDGRVQKFWCAAGEQRTEITVSFHVHQNEKPVL